MIYHDNDLGALGADVHSSLKGLLDLEDERWDAFEDLIERLVALRPKALDLVHALGHPANQVEDQVMRDAVQLELDLSNVLAALQQRLLSQAGNSRELTRAAHRSYDRYELAREAAYQAFVKRVDELTCGFQG